MNYLEKKKEIERAGYKCDVVCFGKTVLVMKSGLKAHFDPYHDTWKHWLNGKEEILSGDIHKFIDWYGENLEAAVKDPDELTEFEKSLHVRLCEEGLINHADTNAHETQALNRLISKGYATFNGEAMAWLPMSEYIAES